MSSQDLSLVGIVSSDIQFLRDEWDNDVDDHSLRRSSTVLRRLLVEGDLHKAWKISGFSGQAIVKAPTLDEIRKVIPDGRITFASAGGATLKGAELRGALILNFAMSENLAKKLGEGPPPERDHQLLDFIEDPSVIIQGIPIRRRHIIKYVSNKLGGAHLDSGRGNRKDDQIYSLLDKVGNRFMLLEKPAIFFELLSIGQAIAKSDDIKMLTDRINSQMSGASA
jgi:hypothetical protein